MPSVRDSLEAVRTRIDEAARAAGRRPETVRLVAVSKTKPADAIREAYEAGQRDFGENYVQEMVQKAEALRDLDALRWHFIGHLQRNKVKQAVRVASCIHTLDSPRLAAELAKRAEPVAEPKRLGDDPRLPLLIEVNVGEEAQKSGCVPGAIADVLRASEPLRIVGLMTVPPHTDDPAGARPYFDRMVALRDAHGGPGRLPELSMGMTHDLEHAVAAGATWVRVGTAIFGPRAPKARTD